MKLVGAGAIPDRDEEAALWCLDLADGKLSDERQCAFDRWHSEPANADAFQRAAGAWDTVEIISSAPEIVQMRSAALDAYRRGTLRRGRRPFRWRTVAWAASTSIAASIALLLGWSTAPRTQDLRTGVGERRLAMLEDGSRVSLDADSGVEARFDTKRRALVLTRGRARFDVAHNPLRPFTVAVGGKLVVATGTSFSVELLGKEVHVVLIEGHVSVLDQGGAPIRLAGKSIDATQALVPGAELTIAATDEGIGTVAAADVMDVARWQQGQIALDDVALPLAVERMNRYLREPLVVADGATAHVRVTGIFNGDDASGFLDGLRRLYGVRAEHRSGKVFLTGG